jgi:hypothetical protein
VSAELWRSAWSEYPDAAGDRDSTSLGKSLDDSGGVAELSLFGPFMATRTEAASSNWTCWCLEIKSFEVKDHSGVCSHLASESTKLCQRPVRLWGRLD